MTAHEIVIRLGRPFDIRLQGVPFAFVSTREVTIPFSDRGSALAASLEVTVTVRPVHDAGGEDYRPVVAGEVVETGAEAEFAGDLTCALVAERERERLRAELPPPKPDRDMNDLRDWGGNASA